MTKSIKEKTRLINIKKYINNEINFSNDLIKYRLNFHISNIKKSGWAKIFADSDNSPNIKKKEKRRWKLLFKEIVYTKEFKLKIEQILYSIAKTVKTFDFSVKISYIVGEMNLNTNIQIHNECGYLGSIYFNEIRRNLNISGSPNVNQNIKSSLAELYKKADMFFMYSEYRTSYFSSYTEKVINEDIEQFYKPNNIFTLNNMGLITANIVNDECIKKIFEDVFLMRYITNGDGFKWYLLFNSKTNRLDKIRSEYYDIDDLNFLNIIKCIRQNGYLLFDIDIEDLIEENIEEIKNLILLNYY